MITSLLFSAIVFVVDPNDSALAFDGYKVERRGGDFVVTGAREDKGQNLLIHQH